ncbi:nicotinamide N-methyltransferase-like [Lissotriton helveticus]
MASVSSMIAQYGKHFDPPKKFKEYCSAESGFWEDTVGFPLKWLVKTFSSGKVKGDTIMQIGMTYLIHLLLPTCKVFKEIFVVDIFDVSLQEVRKWQEKDPGAIDLSSAAKTLCEHEGQREGGIKKEDELRRKITQIVTCDITAKEPLSPKVLPLVDCLFLVHCLESVCPNKEEYRSALKNLSTLLKSGGNLLMIVWLKCTFFMIGSHRVPSLGIDEELMKKMLPETGFVIEELTVVHRHEKHLYSRTDAEGAIYIVAKKV